MRQKMNPLFPVDQVFSYLSQTKPIQLKKEITADVVIVGGGMAGVSAALEFKNKGCSVVLVEKGFCGAGASGKSSGFITPDSEIPLHALIERFGKEQAQHIWDFVQTGVDDIHSSIQKYAISCDYRKENTVVLASSNSDFTKQIKPEFEARTACGYESTLYQAHELTNVIGAHGFNGAIRYGNSFGINAYQYVQGIKQVLQDAGVQVYEETPAIALERNKVITPFGSVKAKYVVLCADRFIPDLNKLTYEIYPLQTFLMLSAPLSDKEIALLYPQSPVMAWDTALIYTYYRMTGDNRLMLGGSTLLGTYANKAQHDNKGAFARLQKYCKTHFPYLNAQFEYMWPGLIGVSKDILPLAGRDKDDDSLYYVGGAAGLPWAAALGKYSAQSLIDGRADLDTIFNPYRAFKFGQGIQTILGNRLTFALSHITTLSSF